MDKCERSAQQPTNVGYCGLFSINYFRKKLLSQKKEKKSLLYSIKNISPGLFSLPRCARRGGLCAEMPLASVYVAVPLVYSQ